MTLQDSDTPTFSKSQIIRCLRDQEFSTRTVREKAKRNFAHTASHAAHRVILARFLGAARASLGPGMRVEKSPDVSDAVRRTTALVEAGHQTIFDATFVQSGVYVRIDALVKNGSRWKIVGFRSSASVKRHHLLDLAVQRWALTGVGLTTHTCEIIHIDRSTSTSATKDNTFACKDVSVEVHALLPGLSNRIADAKRVLVEQHRRVAHRLQDDGHLSRSKPSRQDHGIEELYRVKKRMMERLVSEGINQIKDIPDDFPLPDVAQRQRRAVKNGQLVIEDTIRPELDRFTLPIGFIDFEAVSPALPIWDGAQPFESVPVQVSIHRLDTCGAVTHQEWIATPGADPRSTLGQFVADSTRGCGVLVAYNAKFEIECIRYLAQHVEEGVALELEACCARFIDLLPLVQQHVYHPDFNGRFNLKVVAAAMMPELAYRDLLISNGDAARIELEALLSVDSEDAHPSGSETRAALLAYCQRDTLVLVHLYKTLLRLVGEMDP